MDVQMLLLTSGFFLMCGALIWGENVKSVSKPFYYVFLVLFVGLGVNVVHLVGKVIWQ